MAEIINSLKDILNGNQKLTDDNFKYNKPSDFDKELEYRAKHGQKHGTTTHIHSLDPYLNWRDGFFYGLTGYPGAGKSTFAIQLILNRVINEGIKATMYTPENYPVEDVVEELILMYTGKNPSFGHKRQLTDQERNGAIKFLSKYITIVSSDKTPSVSDVLNAFNILNDKKDHKMFLVDPFNSLVEGSSTGLVSEYLKMALTEFKLFSVNSQSSLVVAEHPKAAENMDSRPEPSPSRMYGGSMWWNKCDCIFSVDRDMFDSTNPEVLIKVWKMKKQRLMGMPGEQIIYFARETCQYSGNLNKNDFNWEND